MNRPGNNPVIRGVLRPLFGSFAISEALLKIYTITLSGNRLIGMPACHCEVQAKNWRI
jgi:hypothetical protein